MLMNPSLAVCVAPDTAAQRQCTASFAAKARSMGIPELRGDDFTINKYISSGAYGTVFQATTRDGVIVALKFYGYACYDPLPNLLEIENELFVEFQNNQLAVSPYCYGYFFDSYDGIVAHIKRDPITDTSNSSTGKLHKGSFLVKVSEYLTAEAFNFINLLYPLGDFHLSLLHSVTYLHTITGSFNEDIVATIFKDIVTGLNELHKRNIIHNDLKVENIMFNSTGEVRIIDFGLCKNIKNDENFIDFNGKGFAFNFAPETLLDRKIYKASDVWQAGSILYLFLYMRYPFEDVNDAMVVFDKIKTGNYNKLPISIEGRDILDRMFTTDPLKRITCQEILQHPFLTRDCESNTKIDFNQEYYDGINKWTNKRAMRKIFLDKLYQRKHRHFTLDYIYSSTKKSKLILSNENFYRLKDAYMQVTRNNASKLLEDESTNTSMFNYIVSMSGSKRNRNDEPPSDVLNAQGKNSSALAYSSFSDIMMHNGLVAFATQEVFTIFDMDRDNRVNYLEFILNLYPFVDRNSGSESGCTIDDEARMFFGLFDINNDGCVSIKEFEIIMTHLWADFEGLSMNHKIEQLFNVVDIDHSSTIDIDEFTRFYKMIINTRALSSDTYTTNEL